MGSDELLFKGVELDAPWILDPYVRSYKPVRHWHKQSRMHVRLTLLGWREVFLPSTKFNGKVCLVPNLHGTRMVPTERSRGGA